MEKKGTQHSQKESLQRLVSKTLELPEGLLEGMPQLELLGNREAVVERCQTVLEYTDQVIRLRAAKLTLRFCGRDLRMRRFNETGLTITGYLTSIEFSQMG